MAVQPRDEHVMDTRTPSPSQGSSASGDAGERAEYKPDLSKEVAMLSTKLINAINYQTNLDDSLQATRHELGEALQELKKVQAEKKSLDDAIAQGVLVKQRDVDASLAEMRAEVLQEKEKREAAERAKRQTDGELESLTSSLFEEANKMVAEARKDTETVERRNSQLRTQLSDTELLLASQQEQLQDLKLNLENLERTAATRDSSVPSTPINANTAAFEAFHQQLQLSPSTGEPADIPPNHPLYFTQLLQPILRTDVAAYADFADLLASARRAAAPHSRNASGTMAAAAASQTNISTSASTSSPNLPGSFSASSSPSSSTFGRSTDNGNHSTPPPLIPALKDTKFYKRILTEDLEPTLRLDLAPGLSFLSRRTVLASLLHGTLVVEPFLPSSNWKFYSPVFPCTLCGEARKTEVYVRRHRFRTSESDEAQRYPLCDFCLGRVRAAGDFVGFLRLIRDGTWRCASEEDDRGAWEEAVRLRERMFWARVGGGVVPNFGGLGMGKRESPVKGAGGPLDGIPEGRERRGTFTSASAEAKAKRKERRVSGDVSAGEKRLSRRYNEQAPVTPPERSISVDETSSAHGDESVHEQAAKELKRRTMLHIREGSFASTRTLSRNSVLLEQGGSGVLSPVDADDAEAVVSKQDARREEDLDDIVSANLLRDPQFTVSPVDESPSFHQRDADDQLLREAAQARPASPTRSETTSRSSMVSAEEGLSEEKQALAPEPEPELVFESPTKRAPPPLPSRVSLDARSSYKVPAPSPEVRQSASFQPLPEPQQKEIPQEDALEQTKGKMRSDSAASAVSSASASSQRSVDETPDPPRTASGETLHTTTPETTPRATVLLRSESQNSNEQPTFSSKERSGSVASTSSSVSSTDAPPRMSSEQNKTSLPRVPPTRSESQDSNASNGSAKRAGFPLYRSRTGSEASTGSLNAPAEEKGAVRGKSPSSNVLARVRAMEAKGR